MSQDALVLAANADNFDQLVLDNSHKGPVLVDFWASRAGPSLRQRELLRRLAAEYGGRFLLVTVETEKQKAIADRFGVKGLPFCKLFRNGEIVEHIHGMHDYRTLIERHILPLASKVQAAAIKAWQQGDQDKAIQVLAEGAIAEPDDPALPLMMAKLLVRQARYKDAFAVIDSLPDALASGSEIQRHDADFRDGLIGQALLVVLDMLGPDDERTRRFRQSLFQY